MKKLRKTRKKDTQSTLCRSLKLQEAFDTFSESRENHMESDIVFSTSKNPIVRFLIDIFKKSIFIENYKQAHYFYLEIVLINNNSFSNNNILFDFRVLRSNRFS